MNKTVFKITIFSLAVCFLTGCEDFLNKDVLGYSTDENFMILNINWNQH